jgi:hypothetical protein
VTGIGWESASTSLFIMSRKVVAGFVHAKGTRCAIIIIIVIIHGSLRFAVMRYTSSMTMLGLCAQC